MSTRTGRTAVATLAATTAATLVLTVVVGGAAQAAPGHPGTPDAPVVVFHEDFENAPDTGPRTMLSDYVSTGGKHYTADPYWMSAPRANGLVLSWNNTRLPDDGTAADNGTEDTAFKVLRQLSEALGKVNKTTDPQTNTAISAYTQDTGPAVAGGKVMFQTDEDIQLKDSNGRFLAFEMSAAATSAAANKPKMGREDPELMFYVAQGGTQTPLTTAPINPITDRRASKVAVTALTDGAKEDVWAGNYSSDKSFLYDGETFGIVIRNMTSAHMGNDGAFDDIKVLDVTPQLDKQFGQSEATTGQSVRLTFTVTNTAELAQKKGWSFTDSLPAGLVVASDPGVVVEQGGAATVQADPGATAITVTNGDLVAGDNALTISLNVTAAKAGTYTNGPTNITEHRGIDTPDTTTVTFKDPTPAAKADLTVRWVDQNGKPLADQTHRDGTPGEHYTTEAKTFPGYELVAVPANATGDMAEGTVVTYVYKPVVVPAKADLTVRFVDEQGNPLADPTHRDGTPGEHYDTAPAAIPGYELVAVPANASGDMAEGTLVTYVYRKVTPVVPGAKDPYVSEVLAADVPAARTAAGGLAHTGSDAAAVGMLAAALAAVGGVLVLARRRARHHR
jgi:uncharacterized repeat protein (TIGR01451 family)